MAIHKNTHNTKGYTVKELIAVIVVFCIVVAIIIRGAEIGYLWRGFWGSIFGGIAGYIIVFFAIIGIMASVFFVVKLFSKSKNDESGQK